MFNDIISRVSNKYAKQYDESCFKILDKYFGKLPRDKDKLGKWFQEKRNQGYLITVGEDLQDIGMMNGTQIHFLTIKYDKEIVLKEIIITINIKTLFKEEK